jgi:hypothetical protein
VPVPFAPTRRLALSAVSGLPLVAIGAGGVLAQSAAQSAEPLVSGGGATPVVPDPNVTGAQPVPYDHVVVGPDGRTLTVFYWHGAQACHGLREVELTPVEGGVAITLWAGMLPEAVNRLCTDIAQLYSVEVVLDEPIILVGGLD